jgi:hypothetical protein
MTQTQIGYHIGYQTQITQARLHTPWISQFVPKQPQIMANLRSVTPEAAGSSPVAPVDLRCPAVRGDARGGEGASSGGFSVHTRNNPPLD